MHSQAFCLLWWDGKLQTLAYVPAPCKAEAGTDIQQVPSAVGTSIWTRGMQWHLKAWRRHKPQSPREGVTTGHSLSWGALRSGISEELQLFFPSCHLLCSELGGRRGGGYVSGGVFKSICVNSFSPAALSQVCSSWAGQALPLVLVVRGSCPVLQQL